MVIASIGPVCSDALRQHRLPVDLEPEHPKMGQLVAAVATYGSLVALVYTVKPSSGAFTSWEKLLLAVATIVFVADIGFDSAIPPSRLILATAGGDYTTG